VEVANTLFSGGLKIAIKLLANICAEVSAV